MKWLVVFALLPVIAFSRPQYDSFNGVAVVPENELAEYRGGFLLPGINYSIGLKMEALVNNKTVFFSNVFDVNNNRLVLPAVTGLPSGMRVDALEGDGQLGYIIRNSTNGNRIDVKLDINVVTPRSVESYRFNQGVTRMLDAARVHGY
ncbi:hypothetical protein PU634_00205 [Oceanimonas pelagia]|uniref:Uncharacterized protein n=1 Tax=Oceanimonas pelagia TaxID=3028314 RepID=A0AA50KPF3_9GAMM|nr:hypothetical protein [Oceanimonas pelagia]WMC10821.1 hypothetical protein PU634_00205 [Oceanimonas pelagia]